MTYLLDQACLPLKQDSGSEVQHELVASPFNVALKDACIQQVWQAESVLRNKLWFWLPVKGSKSWRPFLRQQYLTQWANTGAFWFGNCFLVCFVGQLSYVGLARVPVRALFSLSGSVAVGQRRPTHCLARLYAKPAAAKHNKNHHKLHCIQDTVSRI